MSTAEIQARTLYDTMHLATMDDEVKKQLIILMLSNPISEHAIEPYTTEELLLHLEDSDKAIADGDVLSMAEADTEMDQFTSTL